MKPCPHCFLKYGVPAGRESGRRLLHDEQALNCLSRRTKEYICGDCGRAEAMADLCMPGPRPDQDAVDQMFRTVVYNDRCEGRRLPPGIPWGPSMIFTSGSCVGHDDPYDDKCPECGSLFVFGFSCTECQTVRPALEQLKDHPIAIEQEQIRQREEALEREHQRRAKIAVDVQEYIFPAHKAVCVNCGETELKHADDYICVRCRASDELQGNPLLQHVLAKLDERKERW